MTEPIVQPRGETPTCEVIVWWGEGDSSPVYCGTPATQRYPAMGGGFMHMCDEHSIKHLDYTEAAPDVR